MNYSYMPQDLHHFIDHCFDSVEQLEILVLLQADPTQFAQLYSGLLS